MTGRDIYTSFLKKQEPLREAWDQMIEALCSEINLEIEYDRNEECKENKSKETEVYLFFPLTELSF